MVEADVELIQLEDVAFDLAYTFKQDPDVFLSKPIEQLLYLADGAGRLNRRLNRKDD